MPPSNTSVQAQYSNVLSRVYDKVENALRVKGISVTLEGADIEIGAVELKNGTTDDRAFIAPDGALSVREAQNTQPVNVFSTAAGTPAVFSDILTYTVPIGTVFWFSGYVLTGEAEGKFEILINASVVSTYRITRAQMTADMNFGRGALKATAGQTITVRVRNAELISYNFEAQIYGYLI